MKNFKKAFLILFGFISFNVSGQFNLEYPLTEKSAVIDNYFGTNVTDSYRWLENLNSEKTITWLKDQEKVLNNFKKKLTHESRIYDKLYSYSYIHYKPLEKKGEYYFTMRYDNIEYAPSLYFQNEIDESPKLLIDPYYLKEKKNEIVSVKSYEVSSDNKFIAFSLSQNGADWSYIRIKDIINDKYLPEKLTNIKFASIAWKGNGFFYLKFDSVSPQAKVTAVTLNPQIYYHTIHTDQSEDIPIYKLDEGIDFRYFDFSVSSDEKYLVISGYIKKNSAILKAMQFSELDSFPKINLKPFMLYPERNTNNFDFIDNMGKKLVVLTDLNANTNRLLLYDPYSGINQCTDLVKPYSNILTKVSITADKIICLYYLKGQYTICIFDYYGNLLYSTPFPVGCRVTGLNASKNDHETSCFVSSFYFPNVVYKLNLNDLSLENLEKTQIRFDPNNFETIYITYLSEDSTEIPMYITFKKGVSKSSKNPAILYGYGGFGVLMAPFFDPKNIIWLENGGILAVPQIRGGGEQGSNWHKDAITLKRNVAFNDFIFAAKYLIDNGYTNPEKLAIEGGSNGGLLVGVAMTKQPELFKAAIPEMALTDMLRYQNFTIGSLWEQEYGTSDDQMNFENLYSYSPLHNIKEGIKYPATLAITSDNDDRVSPVHSYKFIAELQEKGDKSNPYVLYVNKTSGHYGAEILKDRWRADALKLDFLFKTLDVKAYSVW